MRTSWRVLVGAWALCFWPLSVTADPPAPPAQAVLENLDRSTYEVVPIGITKQGRWLAGAGAMPALVAAAVYLVSPYLLLVVYERFDYD